MIYDVIKVIQKIKDANPKEMKLVLDRVMDYVVEKMNAQYPGLIAKIEREISWNKRKIRFIFKKSIGNDSPAAKLIAHNASQGHVLVSLENNLSNPKYRNLVFNVSYVE